MLYLQQYYLLVCLLLIECVEVFYKNISFVEIIYIFKLWHNIWLLFMVRAFAHGAMDRRIDPSWWTKCHISHFTQCSTTGMVHIKEPLMLIWKNSPCSGGSGFPLSLPEWSITICPTPYNCIKNGLSALLNKPFPCWILLVFVIVEYSLFHIILQYTIQWLELVTHPKMSNRNA